MIYLKSIFIFISIFISSMAVIVIIANIRKNIKKIKVFERKILWKTPKVYSYIHGFFPKFTKKIIGRTKDKLMEQELLILLDNMGTNLSGGLSVTETIKSITTKIKPPLKNELSLFIILAKKDGTIPALEHCIKRSNNLFLKIMWRMILNHYKNGGAISNNIKNLHKTLYTRINIKDRINAQLLQTKVQMLSGILLPYLLFAVLSIMYPNLMKQIPHSLIGVGIILFSILLHSVGTWFFIKISRFNMSDELNGSMLFEYLCFSIKGGNSIVSAIKDIKDLGILEKELLEVIDTVNSTSELIDKLCLAKGQNQQALLMMLKRSHQLGISIGDELNFKAKEIMEKLENRALRFQQIVNTKALIPMLFCIFPASYLLILTPIIVEISRQM